jgi:hypothetical protein
MLIDAPNGARGSIVRWGPMLQARRSRFQLPMRSLDFFNRPNPSSRTMVLGSTQPLTEMSTTNLPGCKRRPAYKSDNLPPSVSRLSRKCGSLDVTGIALPYIYRCTKITVCSIFCLCIVYYNSYIHNNISTTHRIGTILWYKTVTT